MITSVLPAGWTEVAIGDLVEGLQYGLTAAADFKVRGPRFLRITDLNAGRVDWSAVPSCVVSESDVEKYRLEADDFVFARTGSIEKAARIVHPPDAVFASYLIRGRPLLRDVAGWLGLFVGSYSYVNQARALSAGIGRANLNAHNLATIRLPLPPLQEQQCIGEAVDSYLTRLDDAIASLERAQAKLKAYRASVLKAAVEGRLVPTEAALARAEKRDYEPADLLLARILEERRRRWEEAELTRMKEAGKPPKDDKWKAKYEEPTVPDTTTLPELPEGWRWATTGLLCDSIVPNRDKPKTFSGDTPWITLPDLREGIEVSASRSGMGLTREEIAKYKAKLVPEGSVIMSCIGRFGVSAVLRRSAVINQQLHAFLRTEGLIPTYLAFAIRSQVEFMNDLATSTTIAYLNKTNCNSVPIPLPPVAEQARIVDELERLFSISSEMAHLCDASIRRSGRCRQSVLKWAFEGKLVAQDPNDESAEELLARIRSHRPVAAPVKTANGRRRKGAA